MNVSSLSYDNDDTIPFNFWDRKWRTSFTGGASLEIPFRGPLALVTGLRYVQQGNRVNYDTRPGFTAVGKFRIVQNYVSMPVLLKYRLPLRRLFFSLGPELAALLSGRLIVEESAPQESTEYLDIEDRLENTNLSLVTGLGFECPLENHVAVVSVRYTHGLTGVAKEDDWVSDWKTRGVECLVGMRW